MIRDLKLVIIYMDMYSLIRYWVTSFVRFYFEREGQFSPDQLVQLQQASLSRIICDNADNITRVPVDAFVLQDVSEFVSCEDLPTVDLQLWRDCPGPSKYLIHATT